MVVNEVVDALRPRPLLGIVDDATEMVRRRWAIVVPLALVILSPVVLVNVWAAAGSSTDGSVYTDPGALFELGQDGGSGGLVILLLVVSSVCHAALAHTFTRVVLNELVDRDESVGALLGRTARRTTRWLPAWLGSRLAFLLGTLLCGIGFFVAWVMFWAVHPISSAEELNARETLKRSRDLTEGVRGRLLGLGLGAVLVVTILRWAIFLLPTQIASLLVDGEPLTYVVLALSTAVLVVVESTWAMIVVLSYLDLRSRREGLDLDLRSRSLP